MAEWFGARKVVGYSLALSAILTTLTPLAAGINFWAVYTIRVVTGLLGVSFIGDFEF